jgi:hypothetical protein
MRASVDVGASRKIGSMSGAQSRGEGLALLGRVVDHQHAVDAPPLRIGDEAIDAVALDRVRVAHQHHRRRVLPPRNARTHRSTCRHADAARQRALGAFWITGPSAIGSEKRHAELDDVGAAFASASISRASRRR